MHRHAERRRDKRSARRDGWRLTHILNTHHHGDHTGANLSLKERWGCTIVGAANDAERIRASGARVGHLYLRRVGREGLRGAWPYTGHIAYYFESEGIAFVGDPLFALGCGRLFEGTPEMMWNSLQKLMALPDDTVVYCAHEYAQANAEFALSVEPGNDRLVARSKEIDELRAKACRPCPRPSVWSGETNPFVRPMSENLQATIGLSGADFVSVFAETRKRKDNF